ncbi:hypothetical protein BKA82DRAFT_4345890 [Pisolithus tinctorius]|nr:hypothetical protein BKA82DRAFT_4345890 [Pisolithus tinctorius]
MYTPLNKLTPSFNFKMPANIPSNHVLLSSQNNQLSSDSPLVTRSQVPSTFLCPALEGTLFQDVMAVLSYATNFCNMPHSVMQGTWQEREQLMEMQIVKLITECDTIKSAFEVLANAVQLAQADSLAVDPLHFNVTPLKPSLATPASHPTPTTHPKICFWTQEDWNAWLVSPEAGQNPCGRYGYLEDSEGEPLTNAILKDAHKHAHGAWEELIQWNLAPKTWGKLGMTGRELFHHIMEMSYLLFKFANNGRKLDHLASNMYSAWYTKCFTADGSLRPQGKCVKTEDESSEDEDETEHKKGKCTKKVIDGDILKGSIINYTTSGDPTSDNELYIEPGYPIIQMKSLIEAPAAKSVIETHVMQAEDISMNKENIVPHGTPRMAANKVITNPFILPNIFLQASTTILEIPGVLTAPSASVKAPVSSVASSMTLSASLPMQPPTPALFTHDFSACTYQFSTCAGADRQVCKSIWLEEDVNQPYKEWMHQLKPNGTTEEFQSYYKGLCSDQVKAYEDEAYELVAKNAWVKETICQGTLH